MGTSFMIYVATGIAFMLIGMIVAIKYHSNK